MKFNELPDHIRNKIFKTSCECWLWTGELSPNGYGRGWFKGVRIVAHRIVYGCITGNWCEGKELDHTCTNRACVNPEHLNPVTHKQNVRLIYKRNKHEHSKHIS